MPRGVVVVVALAYAGCYAPHYPEGLACATGSEPCPPGQTCGADNVCRSPQGADGDAPLGDGQSSKWVAESASGNLHGVWGDATAVFAVGETGASSGTILRRLLSGGWSQDALTSERLAAISGSSSGIWTVGRAGATLRLEGASWIMHPLGTANLAGVVRSPAGGAAVGAMVTLYVDVGGGFQPKPLTLATTPDFAAVTMDPSNRIFAVGDQTVVKYEQNVATDVSPANTPAGERFASAWADDANQYVGSDVRLWHRVSNPGGWEVVTGVPGCAGIDGDGRAGVWCASAHAIYRGTIAGPFVLDFAPPGVTFTAIHVVGTEVYAVGLGGAIWHRTSLD